MVINTLFINNNKIVIKSLQGDTFILFTHTCHKSKVLSNVKQYLIPCSALLL